MDWLFILALALASNIDNLAVSLSYGVRGIRIGFAHNLVIAAICFVFSEAGTWFGRSVNALLPGKLPNLIGAALLFLIGVRVLFLVLPRSTASPSARRRSALANFFNRMLAVESGKIELAEALLLGVALSANALANAVGAGLLHMPAFAIALSAALGSLLTISFGGVLGLRVSRISPGRFDLARFATLLSGAILVGLAVSRVF